MRVLGVRGSLWNTRLVSTLIRQGGGNPEGLGGRAVLGDRGGQEQHPARPAAACVDQIDLARCGKKASNGQPQNGCRTTEVVQLQFHVGAFKTVDAIELPDGSCSASGVVVSMRASMPQVGQ